MKTKKLFVLLILIIVFTVGCGNKVPQKELMEGFSRYENSTHNVEIQYPSDWEISEEVYGTIASFMSPLENEEDVFSDNLNITVQDLGQEMSMEDFMDASMEQIETIYPDIVVDQSKTTLNGNEAYEVSYSFEDFSFRIKSLQLFTIKDETMYLLTFVAEEDKYIDYEDTVRKMIDSFMIY